MTLGVSAVDYRLLLVEYKIGSELFFRIISKGIMFLLSETLGSEGYYQTTYQIHITISDTNFVISDGAYSRTSLREYSTSNYLRVINIYGII